MYICYFDETGDDGYPNRSSELFVLTSIYMHYQNWKNNYKIIKDFRIEIKNILKIPVKTEFHTKDFITNKNPYKEYNLNVDVRKEILNLFFDMISNLEIKIINVVIIKPNIKTTPYDVLDNALTYNVQRIENDLSDYDPTNKFMIISDEGRLSKMIKTTRRIQKINYIPSKFTGSSYRKEVERLIEDPLGKNSKESYFIQAADLVSYIVYLYCVRRELKEVDWGNRVKNLMSYGDEEVLLDKLLNVLNIKASGKNKYGIVCYPNP